MRIAIVSREYPPDSAWGGVAIVYHNLAPALSRQGHEVHVICQAVGKPNVYVAQGVTVHRVGTNWKRYSAVGRINFTIYAWLELRKVIKKHSIEVVETPYWSAEGFFYSFRRKTPLVVAAQSSARDAIRTKTFSGIREAWGLRIISILADFTAKRADKVIANSQVMYSEITREAHVDSEKVDIVHYGIDIDRFKFVKSDIREKLQVLDEAPMALFIGRLESRKGLHILCQAIPSIVQKMPSIKFLLIGRDTNSASGGGSFKDCIMNMAKEQGFVKNLMFIDFLSEDELIRLYSACDVFVFPSLHESFGLPVIEAMACGKPVVTTCTGVALELKPLALKGLDVVPVGDAERFAHAIIAMLSFDEEDKRQIARENRDVVEEKFSLQVWVGKMIEVYQKVRKTEI